MSNILPVPTVLLASAARAASQSLDRENNRSRGVELILDITAVPGAVTVTLKVRTKDKASGKYLDLLASAVQSAVGTVRLVLYPGVAAVANQKADDVLPKNYNVQVLHSGAGNFTYTLAEQLLL